MITRTPYDRDNLKIGKKDKVLEVGPGHSPTFRSNVLVDLFVDSNYHRCGNLKIYPHQQFINANGEALPFKDKEFDYVICNQVLEHAENPAEFIREQCRVAQRGYMELILFEKSRMPGIYENNYGELFLNYLPYQSLTYKLLWLTEGDLMLNRCEWKDDIEFIINPTDEKYTAFFTQPWSRQMVEQMYPRRSAIKEIQKIWNAFFYIIKNKVKYKIHGHTPISLEEYMRLKEENK